MKMVSMKDYEGIQGFGISPQQDLEELQKALSAGYDRPPSAGGGALRVESLEATLKVVTYRMEHVKFWRSIPKLPAFSTVEEYNRLKEYGSDAGGFTQEGALPETDDATYQRTVGYVKFLGTTREVTLPMTLVRPAHGNIIALETQNGVMWILKKLERALFFGNSANIAEEFDGIEKQLLDDTDASLVNIIDMRDENITEDVVNNCAQLVYQGYGVANKLYAPPKAIASFINTLYPKERYLLPPPVEGRVGITPRSVATITGDIVLEPDIFLNPPSIPSSAVGAKAPASPASVSVGAPASDPQSKFSASDAGTYKWAVTAINRYGESAKTESSSVAVASGQSVTLTITDGAGTYPTQAYRIWRTNPGGSTYGYVTTIPRTGTDTQWTDRNEDLPGRLKAFVLEEDQMTLSFRQLASMMKVPLATIAASIRWMQLLYGVPLLYAPRRVVILKNIKA